MFLRNNSYIFIKFLRRWDVKLTFLCIRKICPKKLQLLFILLEYKLLRDILQGTISRYNKTVGNNFGENREIQQMRLLPKGRWNVVNTKIEIFGCWSAINIVWTFVHSISIHIFLVPFVLPSMAANFIKSLLKNSRNNLNLGL